MTGKSLSRQLTVSLLFTIMITSIIVIIFSMFISDRIAKNTLHKRSQEMLVSISNVLSIPVWDIDIFQIEGIGHLYFENDIISNITIKDSDETILFSKNSKLNSIYLLTKDITYNNKKIGIVEIGITDNVYKENLIQFIYIISFLVFIIMIVLGVSTKILLKIYLTKPINQFNDQISNMSTVYGINHKNEGEVVEEFKPMIKKLISMHNTILNQFQELKTLNEDLEVKVAERTVKLESAKNAADAANKTKSTFLANMSHEIRTPMNAVLGFAQILSNEVSDPKLLDYINSIYSSGSSLLNLINDILDISKVEAGKLTLEYSIVSLSKLIKELETIFSQKISDKGLDFNIETPTNLPKGVILDETRLKQILVNLIGNSIKFTKDGQITLSVDISFKNHTNHNIIDLKITITDTGQGIPEDQQKEIFDAFTQIKGQKSSIFGGTGLGLTISQHLSHMMNGSISLKSQVGRGSSFTLYLKDVEVSSSSIEEENEYTKVDYESIDFYNANVIIADDIDMNREIIKGFFKEYNINFLEAQNGVEVLKYLNTQKEIACILLDMKMPVMDGYEVLEKLKIDENLNSIPVIAVTASAMIEEELKIKKLCDAYIKKPVKINNLLNAMFKLIPHSAKKMTEESDISTNKLSSLNLDSLKIDFKQNTELRDLLKGNIKNCDKLLKTMATDKIEEFAIQMRKESKRLNNKTLELWCTELKMAAEILDIEKVKKLIYAYKKVASS